MVICDFCFARDLRVNEFEVKFGGRGQYCATLCGDCADELTKAIESDVRTMQALKRTPLNPRRFAPLPEEKLEPVYASR